MINKFARVFGVFLLAGTALQGSTFSFLGTFTSDDQIQLFNFAIASNATVTIINFGYGGGTNAAATVIPPGGFDNLLTLFQADGTQVGSFDDDPGCAHTNPNHGACLDAYFSSTLQAGSYKLALTQSGNSSLGDLSDGFSQQGQGNFTMNNCSPAHPFCDIFGNPNDGHWALDIRFVDSASQESAVPEPVSLSLGAGGLALIGMLRRRQTARKALKTISGEKI